MLSLATGCGQLPPAAAARALGAPKTWKELKEVAEFFQGRNIDGKKVYGAAIYTERGSEGITMGVTAALYSWGFQALDSMIKDWTLTFKEVGVL